LSRELELAKIEISLLKRELNLVDNCPEEFRTVSNSQRKLKNVPSSLDIKFTSTNRFEPLAMLETQTDGDSVDQPASAKSICKCMSKAKPKCKILVLGSSHGRGIGQRLQNALGDAYAVTSTFKPNADLSNVTEDIGNLCKSLTKEDQVVIVGGP
jgi:glutamate racemase